MIVAQMSAGSSPKVRARMRACTVCLRTYETEIDREYRRVQGQTE